MVRFARALPLLACSVQAGDDLGFRMHYHAPKQNGTYPVVLFVSGFSGDAPASSYSDVVSKLTDHGYVVVAMDHLKFPNYIKQGQAFHDIMEWTAAGHLQEALDSKGFSGVTADLDKVAVMAQSAGNHVVGQGLTDGCSLAKAMVMIDPVDGLDPFGIISGENLITPGEKLKFTIPALLLDNELDPKSHPLMPACAPAKLGAPRWFDAAAGPVWNVNASSYGHVDCLDDLFIAAGKLVCPSNRRTDKKAYRTHLAQTVAFFLDGVLNGKTDYFDLLEDASKFSIPVTVRNDLKGLSHSDIKPGCSNHAITV